MANNFFKVSLPTEGGDVFLGISKLFIKLAGEETSDKPDATYLVAQELSLYMVRLCRTASGLSDSKPVGKENDGSHGMLAASQ